MATLIVPLCKSGATALATHHAFPADFRCRWEFLEKFETNFKHFSKVHLDCVQFYASSENVALLALVIRLNNVRPST